MKIDEACIDAQTVKLIEDIVAFPYEYSEDDADHMRLIALGQIRGVLDLADALKEVLKV